MKKTLLTLVLGTVVSASAVLAAEAPAARPPQVPLPAIPTAQTPRPGADALPSLTVLPDPLLLPSGRRAATVAQWEARRAAVKELLQWYAIGLMPPAPGNVTGEVMETRRLLGGAVEFRAVRLSFGPERRLGFDVALFVPTDRSGPCPTIVFPSMSPAPGIVAQAVRPRRPEQGKGLDALALPLGIPDALTPAGSPAPADPENYAAARAELFRRGYALAVYNYEDTGEDTIARNPDGGWAYRDSRFFPAYPEYDWGLLGAWAWGLSRCVDYLETQDFVDRRRLIATGHSRMGKTVLVAGAFDERIALSAPAGSAGAGVGLLRQCGLGRGGAEGLDEMVRKYPNWFSPHLREFGAHIDRLPFDQHWLVALTAPRAFLALEAKGDRICSPRAVRASLRAAGPAYKLYRAADRIGLQYSDHGHAYADAEWASLLDFADQQLRGVRGDRRFAVATAEAVPPTLDVRKLGAVGDGRTKDTAVFQRALWECHVAGGGEVVVPAGDYRVGSLEILSGTTLRLAEGAHLLGSADIADYPIARVRWEGQWEPGHSALIVATSADDIAIVGPGTISGAPELGRLRNPRAPALIELVGCAGVRLENFSTSYANMWSIHPVRCRDVVARGLRIRSGGGNGDGIDVDSCSDVRIEHCDIMTGDDPIALKSGRNLEGWLAAEPTENVSITDCTFGDSIFACIGIGSEMSGSVRNVRIERCTFLHSKTSAIYIKGRPGRGGVIENITGRDLTVLSATGAFLRINLLKSGKEGPDPVPGDEGIPLARNLRFSDIRLFNCGSVLEAVDIPEQRPVEGLVLENVRGSAGTGLAMANLSGVELKDVAVKVAEGPLVGQATNVTGTGWEPAGDGAAR